MGSECSKEMPSTKVDGVFYALAANSTLSAILYKNHLLKVVFGIFARNNPQIERVACCNWQAVAIKGCVKYTSVTQKNGPSIY